MTNRDIAYVSGLDRSTVDRLCLKTDWKGVEVDTAVRFALACGVNHLAKRRHMEILKGGHFTHVRQTTGKQREYLVKLIALTARAIG